MRPHHCSHKIHRNGLPIPFLGFALALLISLASPTSSCTEQEKSSLLQFLAGLSQDGGLTASWQSNTDCCSWEGITCSPDRKVTDVLLASRGLGGRILPSLGNLTSLLRLNLSHNSLSSGLPLELVQSSSIIVLDVSFNYLTEGLSELPSSTPVRPLQVLNISSNMLTGRFPYTTWEVTKSLVALNASNNSFTGQIPTSFCVSAPFFAVLELSYNKFSGSIPPGLSNCSILSLLSAGHNNLNGTLPYELFNVTSLEHLSLPNNQLEGALNGIIKLTNLVTLDLGGNGLSGNIPDSISELKGLEELHLDDNNLSGELPSTLGSCTNLITVDLRRNNFWGELGKVNFSSLPNLKTLDLVWNNFTGTIPESIYSCSNLTALRLSYNNFHGQQLSGRIGNLKHISFLSLVNISLTNITSALQILRSCRNLTTLFMGLNFIQEAMPDDDRIDGFENLQALSLRDCSLSDWMSSLKFLFYIDISNNSLTGEIPTALMEMPMPKMLNLGNNNFTGVIPKDIGQLKALLALNLSCNKLSGEIPRPICDLTNLQVLDLSSNHLTGTIPAALSNLHFLSKFNISNNDLEGPIPTVGQLSTFPNSSFDGNPKLCGPMFVNHCGSAQTPLISKKQDNRTTIFAKQIDEKVVFVIAFGAFFFVGVLYDQIVLSMYFG